MVDVKLLKQPTMILFCLSNIFAMLGFYIPFMFLRNMAHKKGVNPEDTEWLLSILGVFNTVGKCFTFKLQIRNCRLWSKNSA